MKPIRVARSFVDPQALAELIATDYELPEPVNCKLFSKLLRTQDNDHYLVTAADARQFVARVYQQGDRLQRQESDYLFEVDWLNYLKGRGLPVSGPLCRRDDRYLGNLLAPEGIRYYALFDLAPGTTLSLTDSEQLYRFGAMMAEIHVASNDFQSPHTRRPWDLERLIDRPLAKLRQLWTTERSSDLAMLVKKAEEARRELLQLFSDGKPAADSWGPIGGDFHSNNVHFDESGRPAFFNFDLCGYGWRAYDIASFLQNTNLIHARANHSEDFFAGYYSVRPLTPGEHEGIAPFMTARRVWLTATFTMGEGLVGHSFIGPA
jgi:Ser/Thr protein kinase RdoA (MazF antagonist)